MDECITESPGRPHQLQQPRLPQLRSSRLSDLPDDLNSLANNKWYLLPMPDFVAPCSCRYLCASDPSDSTCCRTSLVRIPTPGRLHVTEHGSAKRTGIHDWLALASFIASLSTLQTVVHTHSTCQFFSSGCFSGRKPSTCRFAE